MLKNSVVAMIVAGFLLNSCTKKTEAPDLSDLIATLSMPTSSEDSVETTNAAKAYENLPPGIPIVVAVDKSPIPKDPLDRGPFVNLTKSIAHLGFRQSPDSLWGEWTFNQDTGWIKRTSGTDSTITFRWSDGASLYTLKAQDFILSPSNNIFHVAFNLFTTDTVELAQLVVDSMEYINALPVYTSYYYNILGLIGAKVHASALPGHNLREPHLFGTVEGVVNLISGDTIYTHIDNETDLTQHVNIQFNQGVYTFIKDINVSAPDSINGYKFRTIRGVVIREAFSSSSDTIGTLEGKIWYPQDASHKSYLDIILSDTGERVHLWH